MERTRSTLKANLVTMGRTSAGLTRYGAKRPTLGGCKIDHYHMNICFFVVSILLQDPFRNNEGVFDYATIKARLGAIKRNIDAEKASGSELDDSLSDEEEEARKPTLAENPPPEIDDWEEFLYGDD